MEIAHLHVAVADVDDPWRRVAEKRTIGEVRILGYDDQILLARVGPELGVAPALVQVTDVRAVAACSEGEAIRQVDIDQIPDHQATRCIV